MKVHQVSATVFALSVHLTMPVSAQEDVFSLDGLVVSASPSPRAAEAVATNTTILHGDDLRLRGVTSVAEALRDVAGLDVVRNGSFGGVTSVFLRGGESDYVLVLIDGVQVNQPGGAFDFSSLTTANIERIEILRGPSSALFGSDAVAGVIHLITRTGRGPAQAGLSITGGSFGRREWTADFGVGAARSGYSVSVSRLETEGVLSLNNGHTNTVFSGSARLMPDDDTQVSLSLRASDREYHFPTDGSGNAEDRNAFTFADETVLQVGVRRHLFDLLEVEARFGLAELDGGTDDQVDGPADTLGFYGFTSLNDLRRTTLDTRAHLKWSELSMTGGWELEQQRQRAFTESLSEFGPSSDRSESDRLNRAVYLHAVGERGDLALNGGARLEDNERFGRVVTWQAGASWQPTATGGTRFRASVGRAIKEPTFFENFATGFAVGNPDLDPERAFSSEVGVEQSLAGGNVRLGVTAYLQRFQDLIQYTFSPPSPSDPNYFNVAEASARGVEAEAELVLGPLRAGASWTLLRTQVVDAGFDEGPGATFVEGESLLRRPAQAVALNMGWVPDGRLGLQARVSVVGARSDRDFATFPATPVELAPHSVVDLAGSWSLLAPRTGRPALELIFRIENLLDSEYEEVLGFPAPGRGLYAGARIRMGGS
jgi:vitamin B12 transporter